jgi:hypothetical protein
MPVLPASNAPRHIKALLLECDVFAALPAQISFQHERSALEPVALERLVVRKVDHDLAALTAFGAELCRALRARSPMRGAEDLLYLRADDISVSTLSTLSVKAACSMGDIAFTASSAVASHPLQK